MQPTPQPRYRTNFPSSWDIPLYSFQSATPHPKQSVFWWVLQVLEFHIQWNFVVIIPNIFLYIWPLLYNLTLYPHPSYSFIYLTASGLSCSLLGLRCGVWILHCTACGLVALCLGGSQCPDQGLNLHPLHWKADSWPLDHQWSPYPHSSFGLVGEVSIFEHNSICLSILLLMNSQAVSSFFHTKTCRILHNNEKKNWK